MAWLEQRGKLFHLVFRIGGRKVKKSLKTANPNDAAAMAARIERRLALIDQGDLSIPPDADLMTFLLSDGRLERPVQLTNGTTLKVLCDQYLAALPDGSLESNTIYTLKIHLNHLQAVLGERLFIDRLTFASLQRYVDARSRQTGRLGKPLSTVTIKKELTSLSGVWSWAVRMELVKGAFPNKGLRYPKTSEKSPFQTWTEIERRIETGGLTEVEQSELWEGLYLNAAEIEQILDFAEQNIRHELIYPMLVVAAHTGARRSEILRSEAADFDFQSNMVLLRELKRSRGRRTMRTVPLSGRLLRVMRTRLGNVRGRYTFGIDGKPLTVDEASHYFKLTFAGSRWEKIRGWHVFRHSFISNCASQGIDQRMIDAWTGHQTEEMRKRYRHLFPNVQQVALQSVFGT